MKFFLLSFIIVSEIFSICTGDLNENNEIDSSDITLLIGSTINNDSFNQLSDINLDLQINIFDLMILSDYISSGKKILKSQKKEDEKKGIEFDEKDQSTVDQICDVINAKVKPAVSKDGGDVDFKKFKDGIVYLSLQGSCVGCPSSSMTLKNGIENLLKHYVRDVVGVEQYNA